MAKKVLAIDPGTTESAYVCFYDGVPVEYAKKPNEELMHILAMFTADEMAIEMIASYGMPVGKEVFETCVWIGRFIQEWYSLYKPYAFVYRKDVKMFLCGTPRAKDSNIRQALIDLYPRTGGGKTPQIGTKGKPGPLYGMSKDMWAALGVAHTYVNKTK